MQKQLQKNPEHTASRRYHHSVRSRYALYHTFTQSQGTQTRCTVPSGGNQSLFARNFMCKITDNP
jgi:hypothetical protein